MEESLPKAPTAISEWKKQLSSEYVLTLRYDLRAPHYKKDGGAGVRPKKGNKAGEGSREQVLWGATEGTGVVYPGEKEAQGRP